MAHLTGEFVSEAKFGGHVLSHLASSLLIVVKQVDKMFRQLFKVRYLAVNNYLIVLTLYLALVTPRLFCKCAFFALDICKMLFKAAVLWACTTLGRIPTKHYYRAV